MAITRVTANTVTGSSTNSAANAPTVAATWGQNTVAGNLLLAYVGANLAAGAPGNPTAPSGWTLIDKNLSTSDAGWLYYIDPSTSGVRSGAESFTMATVSGGYNDVTLVLVEYSGLASSCLDVFANNGGAAGATITTGITGAIAQAVELIFGGMNNHNLTTQTSPTQNGTATPGSVTGGAAVGGVLSGNGTASRQNQTRVYETISTAIGTARHSATNNKSWAGVIATFKGSANVTVTVPSVAGATASEPAGTSTAVSQDTGTTGSIIGNGTTSQAFGQSFQLAADATVTAVDIYPNTRTGTPSDSILVELLSTSMTGTVLATSSTILASALTLNQFNRFTFTSPVALSASTTYYIRVTRTGSQDGSNNVQIYRILSDAYASGQAYIFDGSTWSALSTADLRFQVITSVPGVFPKIELLPAKTAATAAGLVPTITGAGSGPVTVTVPSTAGATAAALTPTIRADCFLSVPLAAATAAGLVPVVRADRILSVPLAASTASGLTPAPTVALLPAVSTATAAAFAPVPSIQLLPGATAATAAALVPIIVAGTSLTVPLSGATATALVPVIRADAVLSVPLAASAAAAFVPVPDIRLLPAVTSATATALVPTISAVSNATVTVPSAAGATASALVPVPRIQLTPTSVAVSQDTSTVSQGLGSSGTPAAASGESFRLPVAANVTGIDIYISSLSGSPSDSILVELVDTDISSGTVLGSKTILASSLVTSALNRFSFPPVALAASTTYYIRLSRTGAADAANFVRGAKAGSNVYADGDFFVRTDGVWGSGLTNQDLRFQVITEGAAQSSASALSPAPTIQLLPAISASTAAALIPTANYSTSVTATLATATAQGLVPSVVYSGSVTAPLAAATATALVPVPTVKILPAITTATAQGLAPVPTISLAPSITTATASALAPSLVAGSALSVPLSSATAAGLVPTIRADRAISVPLAAPTAAALVPTVQAGNSVTVPLAASTAAALTPTISSATNVTVTVPLAGSTAAALVPTVRADRILSVPQAASTASALVPTVSAGTSLTVPIATATAVAVAPSNEAGAVVAALRAGATASAPTPSIVYSGTVTALLAASTASALVPVSKVSLLPAITTATAQALVPVPTLKLLPGITAATATAPVPTITVVAHITLSPPLAGAVGAVLAPVPTLKLFPAVVSATAAAPVPILGTSLGVPLSAAFADAEVPVLVLIGGEQEIIGWLPI